MINIILTDTIKKIEKEVEVHPSDYSNIDAELQELLRMINTF